MGKSRYRGYAREVNRRFNPIQLPDESQKLLSEGERLLRGMDRAENQRREQARTANEWDRTKATLESQSKEQSFDLQNTYASEFRKQLAQNQETEIKSLETKQKEAEARDRKKAQQKQFLMSMAPSLVKAASGAIEARDEVLYGEMRAAMVNSGLTPEEQRTYLFADQSTKAGQASVNEILNKLKGSLSSDEFDSLQNLSGRRKLAAQKYYAQNFGSSAYISRWEEWQDTPFEFPDGRKLTARQVILGHGNETDLITLKNEFDRQIYGELNAGHVLLAAESKPSIDQYFRTLSSKQNVARQKINDTRSYNDNRTDLLSSVHTLGSKDPGGEFVGWINRQSATSGDKGYWRKYGLNILADAAKGGELKEHEWESIKNHYFKLDGQKKDSRFGDIYKNDIAIVDEAFFQRDKAIVQRNEDNYKIFDLQKLNEVNAFSEREKRHMNDEEVDALKAQYKPFGKEPPWLKNYRSQSEMESSSADTYLKRKSNKGELSYIELVGSRRFSKALVDTYADKTYDGPNSFDSKDIFSGITASVQTALGNLIPAEERGFESKTMGALAKDILRERVNDALAGKMYASPREAYMQEASKLNQEIAAGNGIWELKKNMLGDPIRGIKGGFKYLDSKYSRDFDTASIAYEKAAKEDKNGFLTNPNTIDQEDLQSLKNLANGGKFPNFLGVLANRVYPNKDHYEIANDLLRANGEDEVEPPGMARTPRYVSDSFKRMVLNKPSMAKTIEAVTKTTEQLNPGTDVDEPALNLMKDKEAVAKGGDNYVLDKSGRTNTVDIASYATGDVYNTFRVGNGVEFGVYKFTGKEIGEAIDKGIISSTDIFDQATQETLQLERFESTGEINLDGYTLPGVGQAWVVPEVSTNEALRTVFGDLTAGLAKNVVKEEGIEAIATVADTGNKLRKAVINKIKDPATKAFFKRLGNTVVQETKEILAEEKTNLGEKLAESTKEDVKDLASLFMQAMAEVDEQMKNYTINKRTRRLYPIDPNNTFSQRGINPYKLKPELFGEFYQ